MANPEAARDVVGQTLQSVDHQRNEAFQLLLVVVVQSVVALLQQLHDAVGVFDWQFATDSVEIGEDLVGVGELRKFLSLAVNKCPTKSRKSRAG